MKQSLDSSPKDDPEECKKADAFIKCLSEKAGSMCKGGIGAVKPLIDREMKKFRPKCADLKVEEKIITKENNVSTVGGSVSGCLIAAILVLIVIHRM